MDDACNRRRRCAAVDVSCRDAHVQHQILARAHLQRRRHCGRVERCGADRCDCRADGSEYPDQVHGPAPVHQLADLRAGGVPGRAGRRFIRRHALRHGQDMDEPGVPRGRKPHGARARAEPVRHVVRLGRGGFACHQHAGREYHAERTGFQRRGAQLADDREL